MLRLIEFFLFNSFFNLAFFFKIIFFWIEECIHNSFLSYINFENFYWFYTNCLYVIDNWYSLLTYSLKVALFMFLKYVDLIISLYYDLYNEWFVVDGWGKGSHVWDRKWTMYIGFNKSTWWETCSCIFFSFLLAVFSNVSWYIFYVVNNLILFWNFFYYGDFTLVTDIFSQTLKLSVIVFFVKSCVVLFFFLFISYFVNSDIDTDYDHMYVPEKIQKFYHNFVRKSKKYSWKKKIRIQNTYSKLVGVAKTAPLPTNELLMDIANYLKILKQIQLLFVSKYNRIKAKEIPSVINTELTQNNWVNINLEVFFLKNYNFLNSLVFSKTFFVIFWLKLSKRFWIFYKLLNYYTYIFNFILNFFQVDFANFCLKFQKFTFFFYILIFFKIQNYYIKKYLSFFFLPFLVWNIFLTQIFLYFFQKISFLMSCLLNFLSFRVIFFFLNLSKLFVWSISFIVSICFFYIGYIYNLVYKFYLNKVNLIYLAYRVQKREKLTRFEEFRTFLLASDSLFYILSTFSINFCKFFEICNVNASSLNYIDITNILKNNSQKFNALFYLLNLYLDFEQKLLKKYKRLFKVSQMFKPSTIIWEYHNRNNITHIDKDQPELRTDYTSGGSNDIGFNFGYGFEITSNFFNPEYDQYQMMAEFIDAESKSQYEINFHPIPIERLRFRESFPTILDPEYECDDEEEESGITWNEWRHSDFMGEYYENERLEMQVPLPDFYDGKYCQEIFDESLWIVPFLSLTRDKFEVNRDTWYESNNWTILLTLELEDFRNFGEFSRILYTFALKYYRFQAADLIFYEEEDFYDEEDFLDWIAELLDEAASWAPPALPNEQESWWVEDPTFFLDKHNAVYSNAVPIRFTVSVETFFASIDYEIQAFFNIKDYYLENEDWYDLGLDHMPFWLTSWFLCLSFGALFPLDAYYHYLYHTGTLLRTQNMFSSFMCFGPSPLNYLAGDGVVYSFYNIVDDFDTFFSKHLVYDRLLLNPDFTLFDKLHSLDSFFSLFGISYNVILAWIQSFEPLIDYLLTGGTLEPEHIYVFSDLPFFKELFYSAKQYSRSIIFTNSVFEIADDVYLHFFIFNAWQDCSVFFYELLKYETFFNLMTVYTLDREWFEMNHWLDIMQNFLKVVGYFDHWFKNKRYNMFFHPPFSFKYFNFLVSVFFFFWICFFASYLAYLNSVVSNFYLFKNFWIFFILMVNSFIFIILKKKI